MPICKRCLATCCFSADSFAADLITLSSLLFSRLVCNRWFLISSSFKTILFFFLGKEEPKNQGWIMLPRALPNQRIFRQSEASFLAENSIDSAFTPTPGPAPFSRAVPHDNSLLFWFIFLHRYRTNPFVWRLTYDSTQLAPIWNRCLLIRNW